MPQCENCQDHSAHKITLDSHEKRIDGHDTEFKDFKDAMKLKLPRWVFISAMTVLFTILGYQTITLISIDKKVAVLYDRENMRKEASFDNEEKVKPCLILAGNLPKYERL